MKGHYVKKTVPDTTNNLTQAVIDYLNMRGHYAFRVNTQGQFAEITQADPNWRFVSHLVQAVKAFGLIIGRWRKSGSEKGVSDVLCVLAGPEGYRGTMLAIEIKHGNDRISAEQVDFLNSVIARGGMGYECRDYNQFIQFCNSHKL